MICENKKGGCLRQPPQTPHEECLTYRKNNSICVDILQQLREMAWQNAIKYRFDPVLGKTHDEYLQALNTIMEFVE